MIINGIRYRTFVIKSTWGEEEYLKVKELSIPKDGHFDLDIISKCVNMESLGLMMVVNAPNNFDFIRKLPKLKVLRCIDDITNFTDFSALQAANLEEGYIRPVHCKKIWESFNHDFQNPLNDFKFGLLMQNSNMVYRFRDQTLIFDGLMSEKMKGLDLYPYSDSDGGDGGMSD